MINLFDVSATWFEILDYQVSYLEAWATLFGLFSVILATFNNKHSFTIGIINCIGFGMLFYQVGLYSDVLLQVFFVVVSIYGYYTWSRQTFGIDVVHIRYLSTSLMALSVVLTALGTWVLSSFINDIMSVITDVPANYAFTDAFTTVASIVAFVLLSRRIVNAWWYWIAVNIVCLYNYTNSGIIVVAFEYLIFLINAVVAAILWHKSAIEYEYER